MNADLYRHRLTTLGGRSKIDINQILKALSDREQYTFGHSLGLVLNVMYTCIQLLCVYMHCCCVLKNWIS